MTPKAKTKDNRPNIVMFLADDQGAWALGCAENRELKTPNLDRLAQAGVRFEKLLLRVPGMLASHGRRC